MLIVFGGMAAIEVANAVRLWTTPCERRVFPFSYVSRGVWSLGSYVRPPHPAGTDITPVVKAAVQSVRGETDVYEAPDSGVVMFLYPPSALVPLRPLGWIAAHFGVGAASQAWDVISRVSVVAAMFVIVGFGRGVELLRREAVLLLAALLAFYPLRWMLTCVQVQSLLTLCIVFAIGAYAGGRSLQAGVLIGLAAAFKPYLGLLVLFAIMRRDWHFTTGVLATAGVLVAASWPLCGLESWQEYVSKVLPASAAGYGWWANFSIHGVIWRYLGYTDLTLRPLPAVAGTIGHAASLVFCVLAVWPRAAVRREASATPPDARAGESPPDAARECRWLRALDFSIAVLAVTLASPIAWEHYFAWSPALFALCTAAGVRRPMPATWWGVLAGSYVLLGTYILPVTSAEHGLASLVNAPGLVGALLLLGGAWHAQARVAAAAAPAPSPVARPLTAASASLAGLAQAGRAMLHPHHEAGLVGRVRRMVQHATRRG